MTGVAEMLDTRWTYVLAGAQPDDARYEEAWRYLFDTYREVIHGYFRRHAPDQTTAQEWVDEFFAGWVEGKLSGVDPTKGMFRQFLFGALRNFRYKKYRQYKRRGGSGAILHENIPDASAPESDAEFQKDYASRVLVTALGKLEAYQAERHRKGASTQHYTLLRQYHFEPTSRADQPTYQDLAAEHGTTPKAIERQLDQARIKFRDFILTELRQTVSTDAELEEEVTLLLEHCREALEGCW